MRANISELNGTEIFIEKNLQLRLFKEESDISSEKRSSNFMCKMSPRKEGGGKAEGWKQAYNTCSVSTIAPIISSHVSPLKNALGASQIVRQFVESLEDLVSWAGIISDRAILRPKQMLVQAILVDFLVLVGHRTCTELEVTVVIRCEFHTDRYHRTRSVLSHYHTISVFATCLVQTRL